MSHNLNEGQFGQTRRRRRKVSATVTIDWLTSAVKEKRCLLSLIGTRKWVGDVRCNCRGMNQVMGTVIRLYIQFHPHMSLRWVDKETWKKTRLLSLEQPPAWMDDMTSWFYTPSWFVLSQSVSSAAPHMRGSLITIPFYSHIRWGCAQLKLICDKIVPLFTFRTFFYSVGAAGRRSLLFS